MKCYVKHVLSVILVAVLLLVLAFVIGVLWPERQPTAVRTEGPWAITNVAIIDVQSGTVAHEQTLLIEEGRIVRIGGVGAVKLAPGIRIVEGEGKFLLPALWDMHTHVLAISPLLDLPLYIAYGVTNVRDMQGCPKPDDPFVSCPEDKRRWTAEAVDGERVGPRILGSTSWMANGPGMVARLGSLPPFFDTATPDQARQFVRHFAPDTDAIKVYDRIPRDAYFALVDEARRSGLDVVGHRPHAVSAIEAATHQKSIEHARFILHESFAGSAELRTRTGRSWREDRRRMIDEHDPQLANEIFRTMKESGTWYVPTHLTRWSDAYADDSSVRTDPLLRYLHPLVERQWLEDVDEVIAEGPSPAARETHRQFYRKGLELTGAAHRAGVRVLAGTDYFVAGADLHRELQQLAAAGLPPDAVLRAATLSPAEYFGLEAQYGTVTEGKRADLLLLNADPLEDVRNTLQIEGVAFNGHFYDRAALDEISALVERRARSWTIGCKIIWRFLKNPAGY